MKDEQAWKQVAHHVSELQKIVRNEPTKQEQKQALIEMMKGDEELGLYDQPVKDEVREAAERVYDNLCEQIPELGCGIMIVENVEKALNESSNSNP